MTVSNGDVVKAVVTFTTAEGGIIQNTFHWLAEFAASQTDAAVLAAVIGWVGNLYDTMAGQYNPELDDPDVEVDLVEWSVDHWETVQRVGEGIAGTTFTGLGEILPLQCAPVVNRRTEKPRSRGRCFLPPMGEDTQEKGELSAAAITAITAAMAFLLLDISVTSGNDLIPGVASDKWTIFLPALNAFFNDQVFTQRRRRLGVGA
jgi:hypothetical protein